MRITICFDEDEDLGGTCITVPTSISIWGAMSGDDISILEGFRRALLGAGFSIETDTVVALYNPKTGEAMY